MLARTDTTYKDFSSIELTDLSGKVLASSRAGATWTPAGQAWFRTAAAGTATLTSPTRVGGHIQWIIADPVVGTGGRPAAVLVANLNPAALAVCSILSWTRAAS